MGYQSTIRPMIDAKPSPIDSALTFDNVTLGYGDFTVLSDISLNVKAGEVVAIMGSS